MNSWLHDYMHIVGGSLGPFFFYAKSYIFVRKFLRLLLNVIHNCICAYPEDL